MSHGGFTRGSEWRKWDLHVHTPASFHWSGGKCLRSMLSEELDSELTKLYETLRNGDIAVFCFMDYWTFDGYIKLKEFVSRKNLELNKTIFPGMELRIEAPVNYRLNIHAILSDQLSIQQLQDFKSKLKIRSTDRQISDEAIIAFAKTLDKSKARVHGFGDPQELSEDKLLLLGAKTVEVTKDSLTEALKSLPVGSGYILLPYDTSDGLKDLDWKAHPHADNYFMQSAHLFESRDDAVIKLFKGIKTDDNQAFLDNFQKTLGGKPKPVVCGSDAHTFANYGNFPSNKATWIKADPTFEGFKQILYEPERACILTSPPEEKTPYLVIDKVRFVDKTSDQLFSSDWIGLNQNLNVIIGGKSSGKSLLLYHIAKTISPDLVEQEKNKYNFGALSSFDFEVAWKDGKINSLSDSDDSRSRRITYIPQMFINSLAEKDGRDVLEGLIESILQQNCFYKEVNETKTAEIQATAFEVNRELRELQLATDAIKGLQNEQKELGDKSAIEDEILRLTVDKDKLIESAGFTEDENTRYEYLVKRCSYLQQKIMKYKTLRDSLDDMQIGIEQLREQISIGIDKRIYEATYKSSMPKVNRYLLNDTKVKLSEIFEKEALKYQSMIAKIIAKATEKNLSLEKIKAELQPYEFKMANKELLQKNDTSIKNQQLKLSEIEIIQKEIDLCINKKLNSINVLFTSYEKLLDAYGAINQAIKDKHSQIADAIKLESIVSFNESQFADSFINLFDRRANFHKLFDGVFNENNQYSFNENHVFNLKKVFQKLISTELSELKLKATSTIQDALVKLFENHFKIEYRIKHKGDDILKMSPGKKGLVLLQLILHTSNATYPILIDQPEDNLDNRTVYDELKQFIKNKKLTRQIIMVTHNANLAVATDSENIIVSNQSGQESGKDNKEFRFEYVNGSLENTYINASNSGILYTMGIREHVCAILEGGKEAFKEREKKYGFNQ